MYFNVNPTHSPSSYFPALQWESLGAVLSGPAFFLPLFLVPSLYLTELLPPYLPQCAGTAPFPVFLNAFCPYKERVRAVCGGERACSWTILSANTLQGCVEELEEASEGE